MEGKDQLVDELAHLVGLDRDVEVVLRIRKGGTLLKKVEDLPFFLKERSRLLGLSVS